MTDQEFMDVCRRNLVFTAARLHLVGYGHIKKEKKDSKVHPLSLRFLDDVFENYPEFKPHLDAAYALYEANCDQYEGIVTSGKNLFTELSGIYSIDDSCCDNEKEFCLNHPMFLEEITMHLFKIATIIDAWVFIDVTGYPPTEPNLRGATLMLMDTLFVGMVTKHNSQQSTAVLLTVYKCFLIAVYNYWNQQYPEFKLSVEDYINMFDLEINLTEELIDMLKFTCKEHLLSMQKQC